MFEWLSNILNPPRTEAHVHEWGMWSTWGITYQARQCKTCGWQQLEELKGL